MRSRRRYHAACHPLACINRSSEEGKRVDASSQGIAMSGTAPQPTAASRDEMAETAVGLQRSSALDPCTARSGGSTSQENRSLTMVHWRNAHGADATQSLTLRHLRRSSLSGDRDGDDDVGNDVVAALTRSSPRGDRSAAVSVHRGLEGSGSGVAQPTSSVPSASRDANGDEVVVDDVITALTLSSLRDDQPVATSVQRWREGNGSYATPPTS